MAIGIGNEHESTSIKKGKQKRRNVERAKQIKKNISRFKSNIQGRTETVMSYSFPGRC